MESVSALLLVQSCDILCGWKAPQPVGGQTALQSFWGLTSIGGPAGVLTCPDNCLLPMLLALFCVVVFSLLEWRQVSRHENDILLAALA